MYDKDIKAFYDNVEKSMESLDKKMTTLSNTAKRIEELLKAKEAEKGVDE